MPYDYDLLVIGSGPGGQKAAIQAAKLGKRVAVVDRREMVGGVCTNTGTIPSKTLREAVLYLTGMSERGIYGQSYRVKDDIAIGDLFQRTHHVIGSEIDVIRDQLTRNHVQIVGGDLIRRLEKFLPVIGHLQCAAVPSRHEPDEGEVNYPAVFEAVDRLGYRGWIGAEYRPRGRTEDGLGWAGAYGVAPPR